jgi:hypothetical protein
MFFNTLPTEHFVASPVWQEFITYQKDEILKPVFRDTGEKPDRMRRQIFHSSFNQTYYIHQKDNRLDEKYFDTFNQAKKEYYCYLHAATLGLNLPAKVALGFHQDDQSDIVHMVLSNQEVSGTRLKEVLEDQTVDEQLRKDLGAMAAYDATKITLCYADNDRKPKNMIVSDPFTENCRFYHVDFEYTMQDDYVPLVDTWFSEDVTREFGEDIVLNRMIIFDTSIELLVKAENLPDDDFKRQVIRNLNQSLTVIKSHHALQGPII